MMKNANTSVTLKNQIFKSGFEPVALYIERSSCTNGGNASNFGTYVPLTEIADEFLTQFNELQGITYQAQDVWPANDYYLIYNDVRVSGFDYFSYRTEGNASQRVLRHDALLDANHNILSNGRPLDITPLVYCTLGERIIAPTINQQFIKSEQVEKKSNQNYLILQLSPQPAKDYFEVYNKSGETIPVSKIRIYNTLGQAVESKFRIRQMDDALLRVECDAEVTGQFILRVVGSDIQIPFTVIK